MPYAGSEARTAGPRRGGCESRLRRRDWTPGGIPSSFRSNHRSTAGARSSVKRPRRSRTSAVRTTGSPRTRKAGKSSEYRIDSPSRKPDSTMTRARFTSLVIQRLQPRASPSARAACWARISHGLARSAWSSRSNRRKSRVAVNRVSCVDVVFTWCGSGSGFSTRRPTFPTRARRSWAAGGSRRTAAGRPPAVGTARSPTPCRWP